MAQTATPPSPNNVQDKKKSLLPPEEQFWKRYSPHHEFPLSGAGSIALHGLVFALLILGIYKLGWTADKSPLPFEPIVVEGGGGGDPNAVGPGPSDGVPPAPGPEAVDAKQVVSTPKPSETKPEVPSINVTKPDTPEDVKFEEDANKRFAQDVERATSDLSRRSKAVHEQLLQGLAKGQGKGGTGSGGGKGDGVGKGTGSGVGDGQGTISVRQKRVLRWRMMFSTFDGEDYRRQLAALGAILAVPTDGGGYEVIRDLTPPVQGKMEDLNTIDRIFWVDDTPTSVGSLAGALRMRSVPAHVVAFFPKELEEKLLKLEEGYKGRREDQIKETRFQIKQRGGKYEPAVVDQH